MKSISRWLAVVSLCFIVSIALLASSAFAQYLVGPGATPPPLPGGGTVGGEPVPGGGVNPVIVTPPLSAGDLVTIPIDVHNSGAAALPNWAGVLVEIHLADPSEVDIAAVRVGGVPVPHPFPTSGVTPGGGPAPGSTVAIFTVFHPAAFQSGISLQPSSAFPAITLDLIGKNTDPINNGDVDINLRFADIFHVPDVIVQGFFHTTLIGTIPVSASIPVTIPGSTTWQLPDSYRWLVPSSVNTLQDLHLTAGGHQANSQVPFPNAPPTIQFESKFALPSGVDPASGHFIHLPAGTVHVVTTATSVHVATSIVVTVPSVFIPFSVFIPGSTIFAVPFSATASIGIEHIPEPTAPLLLLGGMVSLACGFRSRRRRKLA